MYAKYAYLAGQTAAALLADIVAICTGTTDPALLSAGCDKPNTVIMAGIDAAGWSVADAAAGTNKVCISAPCKDDATRLKYVVLDTNTPGSLYRVMYESWNAGSHVGANMAYGSNSLSPVPVSTAVSGTIYLHVTPRHLVSWGTYTGAPFQAPTAILECDTGFTWCAPGQGFTPAGFLNPPNWFPPRFVTKGGIASTSSASTYSVVYASWGVMNATDQYFVSGAPMAGGGWATPVSTMWGDVYGSNSAATPVVSGFNNSGLLLAMGVGAVGDEVVYNGQTYVLLPIANTAQAQGKFMLAKG